MNDFLRLQELAAAARSSRNFLLILFGLLLLFSLSTCFAVRHIVNHSCDCGTSRVDTVYKQVTGSRIDADPQATATEHPTITVQPGGQIPQNKIAADAFSKLAPGVPLLRVVTLRDTVYLPADTAAIVAAYVARNSYIETLRVDTAGVKGWITVGELVQFNELQQRTWNYAFTVPAITNTVVPPAKKPKKWGIGLHLGYGFSDGTGKPKPYVGVGLSRNLIRF
ncbi:MAG: hypothetical protein EOP50_06260 [Sphingobacteriales bacterium]|nr:MAG: hypothetical protein EOP50_06260 [Sphingobacteriales bacterium]